MYLVFNIIEFVSSYWINASGVINNPTVNKWMAFLLSNFSQRIQQSIAVLLNKS
jgi:hypothetical protein